MNYDLATLQIGEALCMLSDEGYKRNDRSRKISDRTYNDRYAVILVGDKTANLDAKYANECGYTLQYYDDLDEALSYIGCIFCGGMYSAIGLYDGDDPILNDHVDNMCSEIPSGNTRCDSSDSDDNDSDDNYNTDNDSDDNDNDDIYNTDNDNNNDK